MCGIVGFWGSGNIQRMVDVLSHRGPDGEGVYRGTPVQLGARSLKITDPDGLDQPFSNEDGTIWCVLNGEIYNYPELKQELTDHVFKTDTDTEMIIHAYEEYGIDCIEKFNGCFAFALWDGTRLICARDRMGQKPLYYYHKNGQFFFASEIKSILSHVTAHPHLNENFLVYETTIGSATLFKDIYALLPATYLIYDGEDIACQTYWQLDPTYESTLTEKQLTDKLRWLLEDAVRLRMRGKVPIGIFLSGGLDSSLLAYLAKPQYGFTCTYPLGEVYDELRYAEMIARDLDIEHTIICPTPADVKEHFKHMIWHLDQPVATAAAISTFLLAKAAGENVKVILNGEGADELFSGYVRYLLMNVEHQLSQQEELKNYHPLARMFWNDQVFTDPAERFFALSKRGVPQTTKPLDFVRSCFLTHRNLLNRMAAFDCAITLPSLLMMADRTCSAFGVENRSPFLDYRIAEFAFALPPALKIKDFQTKYLLRNVARGIVPDAIIDRKDKKGLVTPLNRWFANELAPWAHDVSNAFAARTIDLKRDTSRGEFDRSRYFMISLECWYQLFIDEQLKNTASRIHKEMIHA